MQEAFQLRSQAKKIINFDANEYLRGIEHLGGLFNAILYEKVLEVTYHSYYLKEYNNRWFALGQSPQFETLSNLALDRISGGSGAACDNCAPVFGFAEPQCYGEGNPLAV